jgi:hypothetical protein
LAVIVNLIGSTKTGGGNNVECIVDKRKYERGIEISDDEFDAVNIKPHKFHVNGTTRLCLVQRKEKINSCKVYILTVP